MTHMYYIGVFIQIECTIIILGKPFISKYGNTFSKAAGVPAVVRVYPVDRIFGLLQGRLFQRGAYCWYAIPITFWIQTGV